ncbi:hypothetical protein [Methylobacterium sp. NEAU K]|uniref:hypothetical protein n=1 Tax=Methylobacterium sp. NEAU K TaxID=3064946 RepID=UPI002735C449|nr:hypothetical protein [Methylobacterium sp. NEAU K]MDP4005368.1 hypothetical protein [Methylobacterium sp. NEAU K]
MSKHAPLALAAALLLSVPAGAAHADGTAAFGAANAAQLQGYTASPAQLYVPAGGPSAGLAATVHAPQRPKAAVRGR